MHLLRRTLLVLVSAAVTLTAFTGPATAQGDRRNDRDHERTTTVMEADLRRAGDRRIGGLVQVRDEHGVWSAAVPAPGPKAAGRQRSPDERFRIGSITKTFVATVLLQLQGEGRIDLDDTVERWLPGVVRGNGNDGSRVTVRQLLDHTSGLYRYDHDPGIAADLFTEAFLKHRFDTCCPAE